MLNRIIDFSLGNRLLILFFTGLFVFSSLFMVNRLPLDAYPDVTDVLVQINTVATSLNPLEIEQNISARIEQTMAGIPHIKLVRSISKFGLSQVTLVFEDGTDIFQARSQVQERLQSVELPPGIERPRLGPIATGLGEIYHYLVTCASGTMFDPRLAQDFLIRPRLVALPGVAEVNSWGGFEKEFQILVDPVRLLKHGLRFQDVFEAVQGSNLNVGGGVLREAGEMLLVAGLGITTTLSEISDMIISAQDGRPLRLRDVAQVREGMKPRLGVVTAEGLGETVLGLGFMLIGQNSRDIALRFREKMDEIRKTLPPEVKVRAVYDRVELVDVVIATIRKNLFEGALLVVAILFLFLGNIRGALIVAATIPLSMMFALHIMLKAGIAGTLMSLGAIDFGLIVDSSVIVVENAERKLHEDSSGKSVSEIVAEASKEVRVPTMFGELIIMIVYLPILALEGVEGKLFEPMALTVVFALCGSLVMSLTLIPVLASLLLSKGQGTNQEPYLVTILKKLYRIPLEFAMKTPLLTLGAALIIVLGTIPAALKLGSVFVPELDEGSIVINTVRLPGVSLEQSARFSLDIERLLKENFPDEIRSIWTRTGTPEVATDPMGPEVSDIFIMLHPREHWRKARTKAGFERELDKVLKPIPGMNYSFTQPIEMRFNEMISGIRTDVGVKVFGDNYDRLKEMGEKVEALLKTIPGAAQVSIEPLVGQPVLQMKVDSEAIARYGVRAGEILEIVETIGGRDCGEIRVDQRRFPLALYLADRFTENRRLLDTLTIQNTAGQRIPFTRLVAVTRTSCPVVVTREWGKRRALVSLNVVNRDLGGFVGEARKRIDKELGPVLREAGCHVEFGGQFENLERASRSLAFAVPLALVLIFSLVYFTYGNIRDSLRVFLGVPFAIVGGVWALYVRGLPFSVSAAIGFIALSGVSVLADMVMVSTIRQMLKEGGDVFETVKNAALRRLRPVLMTSLVASLGFVPMAFNTGIGNEVQRPLATVVIGGLISSTLLTLFVLPTLFLLLESRLKTKKIGDRS